MKFGTNFDCEHLHNLYFEISDDKTINEHIVPIIPPIDNVYKSISTPNEGLAGGIML